jgi:hypothetical protein
MMKVDVFTKAMLVLIAVLLFFDLLSGFPVSKAAIAGQSSGVGRYQISAWSVSVGPIGGHHSGYYVLDTETGKVVASHEDIHNNKSE